MKKRVKDWIEDLDLHVFGDVDYECVVDYSGFEDIMKDVPVLKNKYYIK